MTEFHNRLDYKIKTLSKPNESEDVVNRVVWVCNKYFMLGVVAHTFKPGTGEAVAGRSLSFRPARATQ